MRAVLGLVLLSVLVVAAACSPVRQPAPASQSVEWTRHAQWSSATRLVPWSGTRGATSLFVGLVRPEDRDTPPGQRKNPITLFQLKQDEPFAPLLILKTGTAAPYPVLISVFLDYEQVSFTLDGQAGILHHVEIEPGVDLETPITVAIETPGWHDLFIVAFRTPDDHPADLLARFSLGVGGIRTVVCADQCASLPHELPAPLVGSSTPTNRATVRAFPLRRDDGTPPRSRILGSVSAEPGEKVELEIWASNPADETKNYVVVPLLDFQPISLAGSYPLRLTMPPGSELFVPAVVQLPDQVGTHELQLLCIFDPYQPLTKVSDPTVESVMRSGFVISNRQ